MTWWTKLLTLLPPSVTHGLLDKALEATGAMAILSLVVPRLLAWGIPAAAAAADWVSSVALASPLRPLILWKADALVAFLRSLVAAFDRIASTFEDQLQKDLDAAAKQSTAQAAPAAGGTPNGQAPATSSATPPTPPATPGAGGAA